MDNRIMDQPRVKRVYVPPKIVRVRLNPEQAVLSTCGIGATTLVQNVLQFCDSGSGLNCRKGDDGGGTSNLASTS